MDSPILIIDDAINEPNEEGLIIYLSIDPAATVDVSLVNVARSFSLGIITEDDREWFAIVLHFSVNKLSL